MPVSAISRMLASRLMEQGFSKRQASSAAGYDSRQALANYSWGHTPDGEPLDSIQSFLRGQGELQPDPGVLGTMLGVERAFGELPVAPNASVYRGFSNFEPPAAGRVWGDKGFTSATHDMETADLYAGMDAPSWVGSMNVPGKSNMLDLTELNIDADTVRDYEELILPRNARFKSGGQIGHTDSGLPLFDIDVLGAKQLSDIPLPVRTKRAPVDDELWQEIRPGKGRPANIAEYILTPEEQVRWQMRQMREVQRIKMGK